MKIKNNFKRFISVLSVISTLMAATAVSAASFEDVPSSHWASNSINKAVSENWFDGYPDGTFRPNENIKRSEAMTVFVNYLGIDCIAVSKSSYTDVKTTDWYSPYIEAGKDLFPPVTYNMFMPEVPITREDTVYALVTALGYADAAAGADRSVLNSFSDEYAISETIKPYMALAINKGLIAGYDDGTIGAASPLTRAEFATLLYRASYIAAGEAIPDSQSSNTASGISLTDEHKKILEKAAYASMNFGSTADINKTFAENWIFSWYTITYDSSRVQNSSAGPYSAWSEDEVNSTFTDLYGVQMPSVSSSSMVKYSDGYYDIYHSNSGTSYVFDHAEDNGLTVYIRVEDPGSGEAYGYVSMTLSPADNSNGFIITSRTLI